MDYTELHLHTHYSLLDGLNTETEYMERAKELGMTHLACTDHGNNTVHRPFQAAAKKAGITPILGQEMYISPTDRFDRRSIKKRDDNTQAYNHLIVLAQNEEGLHNLNRLSEIAWTEGFYSKPRIDMEVLEQYNEGLIVLSGCLNGLISKAILNDQPALADSLTREFKGIFDDRFFMEIQGHNPAKVNEGLVALANKYGVLPVATSDCHYARKEDLWLEEALLILSTGPDYGKDFNFKKSKTMGMLERFNYAFPDRRMTFEQFNLFLHSAKDHLAEEKWTLDHKVVEQAVSNTMVVANMIGDYPYYEGLDLLPRPKNGNEDELLSKKAWAGLRKKGLDKDERYVNRLKEELDIIISKDFSSYFLIEANAVTWAKNKGIRIGPGRGSGAGSLLNYCLDITQVDPIEHNLLFFRFINPERNDFPDIDTDVEDRRRHEVKDYLRRQYKHVASIATFGTFQGKRAIKDAARVFRVPLGTVNRALKGADWMPPLDWWAEWAKTDRGRDFMREYPEVIRLAKYLYGRVREQGMHAGGIVMSKEPISDYAPMQTAKDTQDDSAPRIPLVAYDMDTAAEIGFIKYDWLGLKALSILTDTLDAIKDRHGRDIDLFDIGWDDKNVYRQLSEGYTKGVFQCEQTPYTGLLIKMGGVKNFDELAASNALVRPGAANSSAGAAFINRKEGREMVEYHHPDMQWFTKETYGVVIYQEQVMLAMTELAGMTMSDADRVRKIIGKKKDVKEFDAYKEKWMEGATKKISKHLAEQLWHDFEAHAGYSFNKSHAVAYSMISYWCAWLKEYYPLEFMWAVLRNEGDKDQLLEYLIETKRLGIPVMLPHVNKSGINFEIQTGDDGKEYIRFGLSNIKGIAEKSGNRLIEFRPYETYADLQKVVDAKGNGVNKAMLGSLNKIGGAALPGNPLRGDERDNFFEYLNIPAFQTKQVSPKMKVNLETLDEYDPNATFFSLVMVRKVTTKADWARLSLVDETGTVEVFIDPNNAVESGQMYVVLISRNSIIRYISVAELMDNTGGEFQEFLEATNLPEIPDEMFKVVGFKKRKTKKGDDMADMVLSDNQKNLYHVLVFPRQFMKAYTKCRPGAVVDAVVRETKDGDALFLDNVL